MNEKPQNLRSAVFLFLPIDTSYVPVVTIGTALYRAYLATESLGNGRYNASTMSERTWS
ncbi:hypothetical protein VagYM19_19130 [Vibrio alginolyticus]|nr:hypothetical protein Vag1382_19110 [Vibrio alginolyticus]BCB47385.1 hypothetical protein VagVIO5_19110 [Vibrio alginolyticus]BCB51987.1 hypothetical protein VagYM19_19130 [Vibrio alginolyticus]BCB56590.1 hypothetical protein VagYM4_19130 [Vibrio alginolyticus]